MVLSVVAMSGAVFAGSVAGETSTTEIVVDASGDGDYTSIQNALDNASSGDTVVVREGAYEENVTVDTAGITLVGPNEGTPGYSERSAEATVQGQLVISADNVTVDGFTVSPPNATNNQNAEALRVSGAADDVVVRNNIVRDFGEDGIDQWEGTDAINVFGGNATDAVENVTVADNYVYGISGRNTDGGTTGISIQGNVVDVTVAGNHIEDVGREETAWAFGITVRGTGNHDVTPTGVEVVNNDISNVLSNPATSTSGVGIGLESGSASDVTFEGNSISDAEFLFEDKTATVDLQAFTANNEIDRGALLSEVVFNGKEYPRNVIFGSVQDAVDAAASGDTIHVRAGTYAEDVSVTTANVTLAGPNAETPAGADRAAEAVIEGSVDIAAANTTIDGFTVRSESDPLVALGGANYSVTNTVLNASSRVRAAYGKADSGTLANNTIIAGGTSNYGVRIGDATGVTVVDNTFVQEAVPESSDSTPQGILLSSTHDTEVRNNTFLGAESGQAVLVTNNPGNSSNVVVVDNDVEGFANGVVLYEDEHEIKDVSVTGNDVTNVTDVGIGAFDVDDSDGFNGVNGADTAAAQADALLASNDVGVVTVGGQTVAADTVTVDADAPSDYESVRDAVNVVPGGTTIIVGDGTYEESFDVDTSNLTLLSTAGPDDTTLDIGADRINVNADNVTLHGFSVVFEHQGIYTNHDNVTVANSTFELAEGADSTGYGIRFEGSSSDGVVYNSEFVGINNTLDGEYGNGIVVAGPDGHHIVQNTFTNNSIGVNVGNQQPAKRLVIANNTFTEQGSWAVALNHEKSENTHFAIVNNRIESNDVGVLVVKGGQIIVHQNDIVDNGMAIQSLTTETVHASANWWGSESGPAAEAVEGDVRINPYLTVPSAEAADSPQNLTEFGLIVEMDAGAHAFGVPGPVEGTVGSIFNDFNGTVYAYADGSWEQVTDTDRELSALDALLVVPDEGETARASIEIAEGSDTAAPSSKGLDAGWNFVGAPQAGAIETSYAASSADPARALNLYDAPTVGGSSAEGDWTKYTFGTATGGPDVSPVSGYWVYAEEDGSVAANVPAGVTYEEFVQLTDEYQTAE